MEEQPYCCNERPLFALRYQPISMLCRYSKQNFRLILEKQIYQSVSSFLGFNFAVEYGGNDWVLE